MLWGTNKKETKKVLNYGAHYSAQNEKNFIIKELADHLFAGLVAILPQEAMKYLPGLWLTSLADTSR